jgi:two-component system C4-dicarboxylate transport response regulator DctD
MACRDANKSEAWRLVAASRPLIFVAEDDPDLRPMLGEILGDAGYRAVLFETAEKLLASLDGATPAAIVTDIAMPGLSGAGLLAKLRRNEDWRGIPVVVMTAHNDTALPLRLDAPISSARVVDSAG